MARTANEVTAAILNNMPDSYNRSTGSVIYDLQAPVGEEMAGLEEKSDEILKNAFYDSADEEHKEIIAYDRADITRKPAAPASGTVTITGEAGTAIPKGTQVASDFAIFATTEDAILDAEGEADVTVECETAGTIGNVAAGAIYEFPVTISGLNTVTNENAFTNGYDVEDINDFDARYYTAIRSTGGAGTETDYENWALQVEGVAAARCFGRTPTRGTVTTYIMNSNHRAADQTLITAVYNHIESVRPSPANSIVYSVTEVSIAVSATIYISSGAVEDYQTAVEKAVGDYIKGIGYTRDARRVSVALIAEAILNVDGITDIEDVEINGDTESVSLTSTQIAVLGGVTLAEGTS